jgi:lipopolysaccharide transport system ATP-binding protein
MPTTGEVESRGRIAALLELGSGFNPEFTGRENVYVNGTVLGLSREQIDTRFAKIAAFADIGEFMEQPVKMYSSGMAVRLAFAVIANVDADILVIDEALAVGDAFFVQKCMRFLRQFMERGTVFFVSHDTAAIVNLCDRAIWLENGRIKAIGRPKEVTEAYLADAVESHQGASLTRINVSQKSPQDHENELLDQRSKYLNSSKYRNDIQLFHFDPASASYGRGGATIVNVQLQDSTGRTLVWCVGGEQVLLRIRCTAHQQLLGPIVGYYLKDRLGQLLFGDNTYLSRAASPLQVESGESFEGIFEFCMPILPVGNYSFCVAIAEGTQTNHVQHHWIHDALLITSHTSSVSTGLLGIPMTHIELRLVSKEESK